MAATMSATLDFPFQADSYGEAYDYGLDADMYYELPGSEVEDLEEYQSIATFNPRWDSLPSNQELSVMASQRLSMMAMQEHNFVEDEDKEVVVCESPPPLPPMLAAPRAIRQPVPPRPRFYSTPITVDDVSTTPVLLYGLEQPSEYALPPRRRLPALRPMSRPMSFLGGSAPSSSHRNQPSSSSRPYQSPAPREPRSSMALKRLSTLIENASQQVQSTVSSYTPKVTAAGEPIVSGTSSASTSRSRVTLATIDSDGATDPSPPLSGSPASSIRETPAPADTPKAVIDLPPIPAATSTVNTTENVPNHHHPPPPQQVEPIRRSTAPDMNTSPENRPPTATKSRVPSGFSSIAKMSLPKLPSLGHRAHDSENRNNTSVKSARKSVPNTRSTRSQSLAQSISRPLPPPPPPHDYSQLFAEIQPDNVPSHTNYENRASMSATRISPSRPTGLRRPTNGDGRAGTWNTYYTHQSQSQPQSQRGREHSRHEQAPRSESSHRMTRMFSQFIN